jgi:multicomponent Na+:H+ antiporter subunit D
MATQTVHHTAMTLSDHLPILQILIPFIAAPLIVFIGQRKLAWPIAFIASATSFVIACVLLSKVI